MIRHLLSIVDGGTRRRVVRHLVVAGVHGALSGAAMGMLVPLARAFLAQDGTAPRWLLALVAVVVISGILHYVQALAMNRASLDIVSGVHRGAADSLAAVPPAWATRERAASVSDAMIAGTSGVGMTVSHLLAPVVTTVTGGVVMIVAVAFADPVLAAALAVGALAVWAVSRWSTRVIGEGEERLHSAHIDVQSAVLDFARQQPVLRSSGVDGRAYGPIAGALGAERSLNRSIGARATAASVVGGVLVQVVLSAAIVLAMYGWSAGGVDAATAFAVILLAARFTGPLMELVGLSSALRVADAQISRIREILDAPELPQPAESAAPVEQGAVELRNVSFSYGDEPVLRDVSLRFSPGEVVGLVGPSGCGKTTILRLIARFMDADGGSVRVGGNDVRDYRSPDLMGQLSVVFQDVYLFDGTLLDNIAVGRPDATEEEILRAARLAGVDRIAERLDGGYSAPVGEGGRMLSGGERQRVSIARALVKDASIVLLDEATASLDAHNEKYVLGGIAELARDRTVIMVAHRPSALRHCDRLVVLGRDGRVEAEGGRSELAESSPTYRRFRDAIDEARNWSL